MNRIAHLLTSPLLLLLVACTDSDDNNGAVTTQPPATATSGPAVTPTSGAGTSPTVTTPQGCPVTNQAICDYARNLERALTNRDIDAVVRAAQVQTFDCPATRPMGPGGAYPLCDGATGGQRQGYVVSRRYSEGNVVAEPMLRSRLAAMLNSIGVNASDQYGPGRLRLLAIGCTEQTADCGKFNVIFSAIWTHQAAMLSDVTQMGTPHRELLIFFDHEANNQQLSQEIRAGIVMADEAPIIFQTGGTVFDLGRAYPLPQ